jgi:hypothetical protein
MLFEPGIHPDRGEGAARYRGKYVCGPKQILVAATSGKGDALAQIVAKIIIAECRGSIVGVFTV